MNEEYQKAIEQLKRPEFGNLKHIIANRIIARICKMEERLKKLKRKDSIEKLQLEINLNKRNVIYRLTGE